MQCLIFNNKVTMLKKIFGDKPDPSTVKPMTTRPGLVLGLQPDLNQNYSPELNVQKNENNSSNPSGKQTKMQQASLLNYNFVKLLSMLNPELKPSLSWMKGNKKYHQQVIELNVSLQGQHLPYWINKSSSQFELNKFVLRVLDVLLAIVYANHGPLNMVGGRH